jgi:deoxyribose-phosphate aldolase
MISPTQADNSVSILIQSIEQTLLSPVATSQQFEDLVSQCAKFKFFGVCVPPNWVTWMSARIKELGLNTKLVSVVGFPFGNSLSVTKAFEAEKLIHQGVDEIDMVMNLHALKEGQFETVLKDLSEVRKATLGKVLKVIIETAVLSHEEKRRASELCLEAQADFVKTSTGFQGGGASVQDILLIRAAIGNAVRIKASGGIRSQEVALELLKAGANRLGTSSGHLLVKQATINPESNSY